MNMPSLAQLADTFRHFAEREAHDSSPLYEHLCLAIAEDAEILALAAYSAQGQPPPNMILAAVHYLLLKGMADPLAAFYPSLTAAPTARAAAYAYFRAFCLAHRDAITTLLQTQRVQTNEVGRCAYLFPLFTLIARRTTRPLYLVDIGCSAGLNLLWDKYAYNYGDGQIYGDSCSPVRLSCELRGQHHPLLSASLPAVAGRIGLDINPIDVHDHDAALWLRALIWPEHRGRAANLAHALELAPAVPLTLLTGDALELLPKVIAAAPTDVALCLYSTFSLYQFPRLAREQLSGIIMAAAAQRDLFWAGVEWTPDGPQVTLTAYESGLGEQQLVGYCNAHGQWLEWLI